MRRGTFQRFSNNKANHDAFVSSLRGGGDSEDRAPSHRSPQDRPTRRGIAKGDFNHSNSSRKEPVPFRNPNSSIEEDLKLFVTIVVLFSGARNPRGRFDVSKLNSRSL